MMTVVIRGRRTRRQPLIDYPSPRTWCIGAERCYCRMWAPEPEAGSAKPGRGGRRKRRRRAAGQRAGDLYERSVLRDPRLGPLPRNIDEIFLRADRLTPNQGRWESDPGRRERRRRAKLRRRRTRRDRRWREEQRDLMPSPYLSNLWEPAVTGWQPFDSGEVYSY